MNNEILLRNLINNISFKKHYIFINVSVTFILQLIILIFFIFKFNIKYLLNEYLPKSNENENLNNNSNNNPNNLETRPSNSNSNSNPPKKGRDIIKVNEDNLLLVKNKNESNNNTINFDNFKISINKSYRKCYESFNGDDIFVTSNINTNSVINSSQIIANPDNNQSINNEHILKYKKNLKSTHPVCYFLKKYVPFINIFILYDLNIYIIKLSLFLLWLNLLFFFNIIIQYFCKKDNELCDDYINLSFKKLNVYKLTFSPNLSFIFILLLNFLCFTDQNLYKVLINKIKKEKFVKKYRIIFLIYYILVVIFYLLNMFFAYKRYNKCLDQNDQKIDLFHFAIEILISFFIYLLILPFIYFLYL